MHDKLLRANFPPPGYVSVLSLCAVWPVFDGLGVCVMTASGEGRS